MGKTSQPNIQGEGDYTSGKTFQDAERKFVQEGPVQKAAREAADALSGPEAKSLEDARRAAAEGRSLHKVNVAHREENLDEGLDETYPASDPVSISPGCD
jgi:hypothetical protein